MHTIILKIFKKLKKIIITMLAFCNFHKKLKIILIIKKLILIIKSFKL